MTPDERELRRTLDARSGDVSPEFRRRLSGALQGGRPTTNAMPAIALVAVTVLTVVSIGILLMSRHTPPVKQANPPGPASSARLGSPWPNHLVLPQMAQISAPSGNVVWVYFGQGFLFRSTDRGDTWEERPLPPVQPGISPEVSFVDAQNGWYTTSAEPETQCTAQHTTIWHTADGGTTWQSLGTVGSNDFQCKQGLSFIDTSHGFVSAYDDNHQPTIYRTSDGGRSWQASTLVTIAPPMGWVGGVVVLRAGLVKAFGAALLVAANDGRGGEYVFRSLDGGATWSYLAAVSSGPGNVVFVTASRWLQMQGSSGGSETTDAGKTWHPFPNDYTDAAGVASFFYFGDDHVGYGTVRGAIHRTVDGGTRWTDIKTPGT